MENITFDDELDQIKEQMKESIQEKSQNLRDNKNTLKKSSSLNDVEGTEELS